MIFGHALGNSETEVGEEDLRTVRGSEDVLRLYVAMCDLKRMTCLYRIEEREESAPQELVVVDIELLTGDLVEEVSASDVLENDVKVLVVLDAVVEGHDTGVVGDKAMEGNLAADVVDLCRSATCLLDDFNRPETRVRLSVCAKIDGLVYDAIGARPEHLSELIAAIEDAAGEVREAVRGERHDENARQRKAKSGASANDRRSVHQERRGRKDGELPAHSGPPFMHPSRLRFVPKWFIHSGRRLFRVCTWNRALHLERSELKRDLPYDL